MIRNTQNQTIGAQLIDATTGAAFAGVVTVYVTIDAGVQAIGSVGGGICTAEGNGFYTYRPSQAETNGALIAFTFTGPGAVPATIQVATVSAAQQAALGAIGAPTAVTALDLITRAYGTLGSLGIGETPSAAEGALGLRRLNGLIAQWATQPWTMPTSSRTVIPIVLGKGTEANPITIGPTGDVVMATRPLELDGAAILLSGPAPQVEVQRVVYTSGQWDGIPIKAMTSSMFTGVYYVPSVPNGEIILWPVPDTTVHSLVIYRGEQVRPFATLTTSQILPDGYEDALEFNLAVRLSPGSGFAVTPDLATLARESFVAIQRTNAPEMSDLDNDLALGGGWYNIQTGA